MSKKSSSKKDNQRYKADVLFFRMSFFVAVCIFGVVFLLQLRDSIDLASDIYILSKRLSARIVSIVLALASVGFFAYCRFKGADESEKTFSSGNIASLVCSFVGAFLYWGTTYHPRYDAMITLAVSFTVLYLIYNIYRKDFFAFSVSNLVFLSTAWCFTRGAYKFLILRTLGLVLCVACCYAAFTMSKRIKDKKGKKLRFEPIAFSFLITVVLISLSQFIGIPFVSLSLAMNIIIAQYLAFGIYYTVKLIREEK